MNFFHMHIDLKLMDRKVQYINSIFLISVSGGQKASPFLVYFLQELPPLYF